jgi:hypothetical protein
MPQINPSVTPAVFIHAIESFAVLLAGHVALWRIVRVKHQILWLLVIFFFLPSAVFAWGLGSPEGTNETLVLSYFLLLSFSGLYILLFPCAQAASPSLVILLLLELHRAEGGLTKNEVLQAMKSDTLFQDGLKDLHNDGLFRDADIRPGLSHVGRLVAAAFFYYRRILRLPRGEG